MSDGDEDHPDGAAASASKTMASSKETEALVSNHTASDTTRVRISPSMDATEDESNPVAISFADAHKHYGSRKAKVKVSAWVHIKLFEVPRIRSMVTLGNCCNEELYVDNH